MEFQCYKGVVMLLVLDCWFCLATGSLTCLSCVDVVDPTDCNTVTHCGKHESCYIDALVTSIGHLRYNMGCRDEKQCSSLVNRRSSLRRNTNDILVCSECCTGNACNSAGCGKTGLQML